MHIALLNPNLVGPPKLRWTGEHLGLGYLAASLVAAGHTVDIVDGDLLDLSPDDELERVTRCRPDLLGVSVAEDNEKHTAALLRRLQEVIPDVPICAGGHLVSALPADQLTAWPVDLVCRGEGETPLAQLAGALEQNASTSGIPGIGARESGFASLPRAGGEDLDRLPFPIREYTRTALDLGFPPFIASSRGCYASCRFCSIAAFYSASGAPRWRARSPENVVAEVLELHRSTGCDRVIFVDDNFIGPRPHGPERAQTIAAALARHGAPVRYSLNCRVVDVSRELFRTLADAGLENVFLGLESFESTVLRKLGKGTRPEDNLKALEILHQLGVSVNPSVIMFTPWSTVAGMLRAVDVLESYLDGFDISILMSRLWPLRGTRFEQIGGRGSRPDLKFLDRRTASMYAVVERYSDQICHLNNTLNTLRKARFTDPGSTCVEAYRRFEAELRALFRSSLEHLGSQPETEPPPDDLGRPWEAFVARWEAQCMAFPAPASRTRQEPVDTDAGQEEPP